MKRERHACLSFVMNLHDLDYNLPKALIAQKPQPVRTDSRLLTDIDNQIKHSTMNDFPEMIDITESRNIPYKICQKYGYEKYFNN